MLIQPLRLRATRRLLLCALASTLLAACGGGGGGGSTPQTVTIPFDANNTGDTFHMGTSFSTMQVGDNPNNAVSLGHVRFPLALIPANATVTQVILRVRQGFVEGAPYPALGTVRVDHIDQGATLDFADNGVAPLTANIGTISTDATIELKTLDVTSSVVADRTAGRTTTCFRLGFTVPTDGDAASDLAYLGSGQNVSDFALEVTYTLP